MSYLEEEERKGPGTSQVLGWVQIVPQGPHRTQGPVFFELSIYNGSESRNSHRRLVVASFTEVQTGYRGFETKRNPVFRILVLCIENYLPAYMSDNLQMEVAFARYY